MNQQPLVSIVTPTKNRGKYIKRAIESVLNQTFKNIELIIVDGGSTDNTKEVVKSYLTDPRIRYIYKEDRHATEGLNNGIEISEGKYISILDSDDFWCNSRKLEKQVQFLEDHPDYVLIGGGAIAIDEDGKELYRVLPPERDEEIRKVMLFDCVFQHGTIMFRKDVLEKVGGYDEKMTFSWDWDLWLRMGKFGKFYNFQEYFLYYLIRRETKTKYIRQQNAKFSLKLKWKYRNGYPNFWKAYLLGLGCYIASLFPHQEWFSKLLIIPKIKNLFFRRQIYKK